MQIEESKLAIIAKAVIAGIVIDGIYGAVKHTAQELLDRTQTRTETIDKLYGHISAQIENKPKKSLSDRTVKSAHTLLLETQLELLETIYDIRINQDKEAADNKKKRNDAAQKLALLKHIQNEKEVETLKGLTLEDLNKQIAEAEALVEA